MAKVGSIIPCGFCGEDMEVTNPNMRYHPECARLKNIEDTKKRQAKAKENGTCIKRKNKKSSKNKNSLADMEREARQKNISYGKLRGQEYLKTIPSVLDGWNH